MKTKLSTFRLVLPVIYLILFVEPIKMIAVAADGSSFFSDFAFITNEAKMPAVENEAVIRIPSQAATSSSAALSLVRFIDQESPASGQEFRLRLRVDPAGQAVNLVDAEITYSTSTLRLINIETADSAFYLNLIRSERLGEASIIAMQPWPGIATGSVAADLVFIAVEAGAAEIGFTEDSAVLANDGYGTDVLKTADAISLMINQ